MAQTASIQRHDAALSRLKAMRDFGGAAMTRGIADEVILGFLDEGGDLAVAIERAYEAFETLKGSHPEFLALDESEQVAAAHSGLTNFYTEDAVNPYVAVAAAGPWIVSAKGAVIYDCGGYGMLGLGHAPDSVLDAMNKPHVMANIMTGSVSMVDFIGSLKKEIGHTRGGMPYATFLCLNSGSEAMSVASRIADVNAKDLTDPGCRHEGRRICGLTLEGSFHGRTSRPAKLSHSTTRKYQKHLASYRDSDYLITVAPNDVAALEDVYAQVDEDRIFIEAFFMEPVMGEGNPGVAITPEFYKRARELTNEHGSMFVVDSIQAGLRAHGVLSIVDYPGFEGLDIPDMESYSKALNAGQYPLSVLALSEKAASTYKQGLYGNTMTTNPRALDVAVAVLNSFSEERRVNIRRRGEQLVAGLEALADELDGAIKGVQGTGLLVSCELAERYKVYGADSTEDYLRRAGLCVIHGGAHSLRYTPVFDIGEKEVDLIVDMTREALLNGPQA
jgi:acetylornithine/succinyldiaminopimelate/putrescine aminotransferase